MGSQDMLSAVKRAESECDRFLQIYNDESAMDIVEKEVASIFSHVVNVMKQDPKLQKEANEDPAGMLTTRVIGFYMKNGVRVGLADTGHLMVQTQDLVIGHNVIVVVSLPQIVAEFEIKPTELIKALRRVLDQTEIIATMTQIGAMA